MDRLPGSIDHLPDLIEIEPTETCNLRCRMCHVSYMPNIARPALDIDLIDKLSNLKGRTFVIGAEFEPMMNRNFNSMIRKLTALRAKLHIVTNGTLIDDEALSVLADADFKQITFSFDGVRKDTYEHIRRRAKYRQAVDRIVKTRERFKGRETFFAVNSTMMRRNMDEIGEMIDFWDGHGFDALRLITMVIRHPDLIRESLYPVRREFFQMLDIVGARMIAENRRLIMSHPWFRLSSLRRQFPKNVIGADVRPDRSVEQHFHVPRSEMLLGQYEPGVGFPCKTPWTHARIKANGKVDLCYQIEIGDLTRDSFEDIWFGPKASAVRHFMRTRHQDMCTKCDFYRFCLNPADQNINDPGNYFAGSLLQAFGDVDFEQGTVRNLHAKSRVSLGKLPQAFDAKAS